MRPKVTAYAFVFISSFSLMVIEVVAGRIMAPWLGNSIYTWTSVIGVVLAGIAVGNFCGGMLAEKGATNKTVGLIFLIAAFTAAVSRYLAEIVGSSAGMVFRSAQIENLAFALAIFFPISFLLSLVTPIVVTASLTSLEKAGTTVGGLYAVSAMASILGTFVTGFFLISFFGVTTIMLMVAAVLALTGILAVHDPKTTVSAPTIGLLFMLWGGLFLPKSCHVETAYYCIILDAFENEELGKGTRLKLDRLVHSFIYEDPRKLEYDYETAYAIAGEYVSRGKEGRPLEALFIGGGGYTMPRYLADRYPGSGLTVVEIDPGITKLMIERFGLDPDGPIRTVNEDARLFLMRHAGDAKYDLVFGDAFNDYSIPYHLTTVEFARMVADRLSPGGMYALNVIDDYSHGRVLSSFMSTLREVFPHVEMVSSADWRTSGRLTYVILASFDPIRQDAWRSAALDVYPSIIRPARIATDSSMEELFSEQDKKDIASRKSVTLTDDYAPVDNLIAPVFDYGRR